MTGKGARRRSPAIVVAALAAVLLVAPIACTPRAPDTPALRVCADPNNLPFSNRAGEGLENALVALLADELGLRVEYTWWAQRRGYVRQTLGAGICDVIPGIVASSERVLATRPYYRPTYVFATRRDRGATAA